MKKSIPIGISNFKELIEGNYYFVDKTSVIKEFIRNSAQVILTPRPRRFGKTLNMSIIKHFFDMNEENKHLFKGLKIEQDKETMKLNQKYPVIFISFKGIKYENMEDAIKAFASVLSDVYKKYMYLLDGDNMVDIEKREFNKVLNKEADIVLLSSAISNLMAYLSEYHNKKVILLIDEYDVPIQEGYIKGYYEKIISFERNMLSEALKDNNYLEKAMLTGILRVAKESIFSGLNNLKVSSLTGFEFSEKFGFTESEVIELLKYYNLQKELIKIKDWYNGYIFGDTTIYNPWSVLNYLDNIREGLKAYWINTSANDLIKGILSRGNEEIKRDLEILISGEKIKKVVNDNIVMTEIEDSSENLWSFLLFTGYLKVSNKETVDGDLVCELKVPNKEVYTFYRNIIKKWFSESISSTKYNAMIKALITGDIKVFEYILKEFVLNSISYFDIGGKEPEKVYHAFVLGMLISLSDDYYVKSNKESGYGRYDVMLVPKEVSKLAIIIEFKKISDFSKDTMEEATEEALKQIKDMNYRAELIEGNVENIIELAIVFRGKEVKVTKR
ncbi:AAA family ATPase [Clostridium magnum]|uniref:Putative AAA-ATPase n=1 Tax=Clostridium magnum DSM 2767 TaxID=1121326 RepID=A0A161YII4_9CLOT|nr:AAA family ATPase [Clostridium magnum]KZL90172.1 putative AAA-ATPase [Clostridium magnum DSM 2767]SHH63187.1 PD-(D/E)XK nuclease superfamily protein [Clostridium magnum DSM 2767]